MWDVVCFFHQLLSSVANSWVPLYRMKPFPYISSFVDIVATIWATKGNWEVSNVRLLLMPSTRESTRRLEYCVIVWTYVNIIETNIFSMLNLLETSISNRSWRDQCSQRRRLRVGQWCRQRHRLWHQTRRQGQEEEKCWHRSRPHGGLGKRQENHYWRRSKQSTKGLSLGWGCKPKLPRCSNWREHQSRVLHGTVFLQLHDYLRPPSRKRQPLRWHGCVWGHVTKTKA